MEQPGMKAKITKDGKISLKLDRALWGILERALERRIYRKGFELELFAWFLLKELLQKIQLSGEVVRFRKSEFFALFHEDTMENIDEPTQIILKDFITPLHQELIFPSKKSRS